MHRNNTRIPRAEFETAIRQSDGTYRDIAFRLGIAKGTLLGYRRRRAYVQDLCDERRRERRRCPSYGLSDERLKEAFVSANGDLTEAARAVGRHRDTMKYHLREKPALRAWYDEHFNGDSS